MRITIRIESDLIGLIEETEQIPTRAYDASSRSDIVAAIQWERHQAARALGAAEARAWRRLAAPSATPGGTR